MSIFPVVLKIFERRQYKKADKKKPVKWERWMGEDAQLDAGFYCTRLQVCTDPISCAYKRLAVQHPAHETCKACPLGYKLERLACVGHHGQYAYCPTCPSKVGCKTITDLSKNPVQVSSHNGEFPVKEITVAKSTAKNKTKNEIVEDDEDEDLEDDVEETEEDDVEEEEDEEEEEEDEKPAKAKKKGPQKGVVPKGLVPREPVQVPKDVLAKASKPVRLLIKTLNEQREKGDKEGQRKTRAALRKEGFRLSSLSSANPQTEKAPKKKKAADEDDE